MNQEEILQDQLHQAGYDVPHDVVQEFSQFLQSESEHSRKNQNKTNPESPETNTKTEKKTKKSKKQTAKKKSPTHQTRASIPVDSEQEESIWISKIQQLQQRAKAIDLQLKACNEICDDNAKYSAEPFYFFNYEHNKDPYPRIKKYNGGHGYIMPPPWRANRRRYPIYKNEVYGRPPYFIAELRASERKPRPWIPGPEHNGQDLRFRIREKMVYSHPDYRV